MNKKCENLLLVIAVSLCFLGQQIQAQQCEAIGKYGMYNTTLSSNTSDKVAAFRHWFCRNDFKSSAAASEAGLSLGIPIEGVEIGFGFDSNSSNWSTWKSEFCSTENTMSSISESSLNLVKTIDSRMADVLEKCVTNQDGLHLWIETGSDPRRFGIKGRYVSAGQTKQARIESFSINKSVKCEPKPKKKDPIDGATKTYICTRSKDEAILVGFNASERPIWDTPPSLPAIVRFTREEISFPASSFVRGTNVEVGGQIGITYGMDLLHNAAPYIKQPNAAEYDFKASMGGNYDLWVEYAAYTPRPVEVYLNGRLVTSNGLSTPTGDSWLLAKPQWVKQEGVYPLNTGANVLRLSRNDVFPHIRSIKFAPK